MIFKGKLSIAVLVAAFAVSALEPLDFVTKEVAANVDVKSLAAETSNSLSRFDKVIKKAAVFATSLKKEDPETADAVTKRIEIAKRLKTYIEARRAGSAEMQILVAPKLHACPLADEGDLLAVREDIDVLPAHNASCGVDAAFDEGHARKLFHQLIGDDCVFLDGGYDNAALAHTTP